MIPVPATPDPPDGDKRVRVTCFDPVTGESETQPLDPDNYILTLGERCEITACQVYANGTVQLTIKRGADREAPDEAGRICCRGMGADGGCNICAAEATR